jgi:hypothetical protein
VMLKSALVELDRSIAAKRAVDLHSNWLFP